MRRASANPALVFDCQYNGLSIIQELGRHGVKVYAVDSARSVGTYSRYATFWRCPDPLFAEQSFIQFLLDKGPYFDQRPVLFPTNDHWAAAISKHRDQLERYYIPCVAKWESVQLLLHKDRFYAWAMERGYPVPRAYSLRELVEAQDVSFPVVAKPRYRRMSGLTGKNADFFAQMDAHRMVKLDTPDSLRHFISTHEDLMPHMVFLEYVPGMADTMYTIGIYADQRSLTLGVFTGRKVRGFPPDIGDCMVGQAERLPSELVLMVNRIVEDLGYHGIAEFEFKKAPNSTQFKLIEINPRSWSWIGITPACGVSLPWIAYQDLTMNTGVTYSESAVDHGDIKWIRLLDDFRNCVFSNKNLGFPQFSMNPRQWWSSLRAQRRIWAEFASDDPLPGMYSLLRSARGGFGWISTYMRARNRGDREEGCGHR